MSFFQISPELSLSIKKKMRTGKVNNNFTASNELTGGNFSVFYYFVTCILN